MCTKMKKEETFLKDCLLISQGLLNGFSSNLKCGLPCMEKLPLLQLYSPSKLFWHGAHTTSSNQSNCIYVHFLTLFTIVTSPPWSTRTHFWWTACSSIETTTRTNSCYNKMLEINDKSINFCIIANKLCSPWNLRCNRQVCILHKFTAT